jgi:catechol 2,3-dioxygenase-like lactoylglutathione lyase family enzyme
MEVEMSTDTGSTETSGETAQASDVPKPGEFRLEVIALPVSDVDRAKAFYEGLDWRLDIDFEPAPGVRVVQFTPPGSGCSFSFGKGFIKVEPGSLEHLEVAVHDIEAARDDLVGRGVNVGEIYHRGEGGNAPGPDPDRTSYNSYAEFSDPDGNGWVLQEITERLPGR